MLSAALSVWKGMIRQRISSTNDEGFLILWVFSGKTQPVGVNLSVGAKDFQDLSTKSYEEMKQKKECVVTQKVPP